MGSSSTTASATADPSSPPPPPPQRGNLLPPPPLDAVLTARQASTSSLLNEKVLLVTNYHPFFDIVYAVTPIAECRRPDISDSVLPVGFGNRLGRTYLLSEGLQGHTVDGPTCVACRGVSQYMDTYYADAVEEAVRTSPYNIDSTHITLFVNVPRAFSFSWAAVAALFVKSAVVYGGGRGLVGAALCGLIPEEYASFKDMFTPDMRARIVSRLSKTIPSAETSTSAPVALGGKRSRDEDSTSTPAFSAACLHTPYITRGFEYHHQDENATVSNAAVAAAAAAMIRQAEAEGKAEGSGTTEAAIKAAAAAASSIVLSSPTLPEPSTILVEVDIRHFLLEMLTGETPLESLKAVTVCMTEKAKKNDNEEEGDPSDILPISATAHLSHGARNHGDGENSSSVLPKDWCTNKGSGGGFTPLPGFVLDDYVLPFLLKSDVSSPWGATATTASPIQSILTAVSELQSAAASNSTSEDPYTIAHRCRKFYASHLSVADTLSAAVEATPIQISQSSVATNATIVAVTKPAAVIVNVRHSSVLLIGKYTKFLRGMSQSPWFCDGARIGGTSLGDDTGDNMDGTADDKLHSLQETVANPLLETFYPVQLGSTSPSLPSSTAIAAEEEDVVSKLPVVAPGGTNAARDVGSRHAQGLARYWATSGGCTEDASSKASPTHRCPLADRILPIIYQSAAAAAMAAENEKTPKQQSLRTIKQAYNQPRGPAAAGAAATIPEETAPAFTKYLSTPIRGIDPVLTGMSQVKGFGHYKFHTAGREDVDVRMLGTGRPFVLEMLSPERCNFTPEQLRGMEEMVNRVDGDSAVHIHGLAYTNAAVTVALSKHSSEKKKVYRCVAWSSRRIPMVPQQPSPSSSSPVMAYNDPLVDKLHAMTDIVCKQTTPLRVLHRRSLLTRDKMIHSVHITPINEHWMIVDLETQAGTYVKEFIHGDCGRTQPNLGSLLESRTDIIQLDVLGMSHLATEC